MQAYAHVRRYLQTVHSCKDICSTADMCRDMQQQLHILGMRHMQAYATTVASVMQYCTCNVESQDEGLHIIVHALNDEDSLL